MLTIVRRQILLRIIMSLKRIRFDIKNLKKKIWLSLSPTITIDSDL